MDAQKQVVATEGFFVAVVVFVVVIVLDSNEAELRSASRRRCRGTRASQTSEFQCRPSREPTSAELAQVSPARRAAAPSERTR